jgi:ubiquinone/menaquinone biosynthesis C-methylase UbiE
MTNQRKGETAHDHDWNSAAYVQHWVSRDDGRQDDRQPLVRQTVVAIPHPHDASINVLDIGAGYGILSAEVLRVFPNAKVTLQDISAPMFDHARQRLAPDLARVSFVNTDFSAPKWTGPLGGPFDVAVSAIAIHNLYDDGLIASVYKDVRGLMAPGGVFLNLDYAEQAGGLQAQLDWLREAGFSRVDHERATDRVTLLKAYV